MPAAPCSLCGKEFPSRSQLFKHLKGDNSCAQESGQAAPPKLHKVALIYGYTGFGFCGNSGTDAFSDSSVGQEDQCKRIGDEITTEEALWQAVLRAKKQTAGGNEVTGPPGLSRAAHIEPRAHSVCSLISFNCEKRPDGFVASINRELQSQASSSSIVVFGMTDMVGNFEANRLCERRHYDCECRYKPSMLCCH
jgi:tRNA U38,U39,U40 pseudouridine synthase TruA